MAASRIAKRKTTAKAPKSISRHAAPRRVDLDLGVEKTLRGLMIIQRKDQNGFLTVYRGSRADFVNAGVPGVVLDQPTSRTPYEFRTDGRNAELIRDGSLFELTLHWTEKGPWYYSAGHPALDEISRMIRIDAGAWLRGRTSDYRRPMVQTDTLLDDPRAVDYRQPRARKYRFDCEEMMQLQNILDHLCVAIGRADISLVEAPIAPKPRQRRKPPPAARARLAEAAKADTQVQALIASAVGEATNRKLRPQPPEAANG